eukprot:TRINITY_DN66588_c10_g1_i1.p1 TRINITY_DN66588_c10_g1~~TRINITY_DN66588_c10_g1_i1.p1  ORF type:complete len:616 (+),score=74.61 TRINITY_DN66588_c10_g1_i1:22-1848(+)
MPTVDEEAFDTTDLHDKARIPEEQLDEFLAVFGKGNYVARMLTKAWCGTMKKSSLRGLYWRLFLGCFAVDMSEVKETRDWFDPQFSRETPPPDTPHCKVTTTDNMPTLQSWLEQIRAKRKEYSELKAKREIDPHAGGTGGTEEEDVTHDNPLMGGEDSTWKKFFKKTDIEKMVHQDVIRLHFEHEFFQSPHIKKIMQDGLTLWAEENESISYRQGMNEVFGVLLFLFTRDSRRRAKEEGYLKQQNNQPGEANTNKAAGQQKQQPTSGYTEDEMKYRAEFQVILNELLDWQYLEHDVYNTFDVIMKRYCLQSWYHVAEQRGRAAFGGTQHDAEARKRAEELTPVVKQCKRIQNTLLKKLDPPLYNHLTNLEVEPQIYALRWLRLLFVREFLLDDVMILWDAVFADLATANAGCPLGEDGVAAVDLGNLIPHMAVSMIQFMKDDLLPNDYNQCIKRLMRFPPTQDVHHFVRCAVHTRYENDSLLHWVVDPPPPPPPPPTPPPSLVAPSASAATTTTSTTPIAKGPAKKTVQMLQEEIEAMKATENRMGQRIEKIVSTLQRHWFSVGKPEDVVKSTGEIELSIAEMKNISYVLLGRITEEDLLEMEPPPAP